MSMSDRAEGAPVAVRSAFESSDLEEVRILLAQANNSDLRVERPADAAFGFAQAVVSDGTMTVSSMRFSGRVTAHSGGAREVLFTDIASGRYAWSSRGQRGDQDRSLILPARHELSVEFDTVQSVMIAVEAGHATRWFARYGGLPPSPALLHRAAAGSVSVRHAIRFCGQVASTEAFDSELVRASLLDVLLSMTTQHLLDDAPARVTRSPASLLRAEEYLRAHAAEAITMADVADAAGLSIRGLHAQFTKWLHVTPGQYLRTVRLGHVRAELVAARDQGRPTLVADVARRWGFAHLGRFARTYTDTFGEQPSATLRRTP